MQSGFVVIPKSSKKERITENCQVFDWSISNEDMKQLVKNSFVNFSRFFIFYFTLFTFQVVSLKYNKFALNWNWEIYSECVIFHISFWVCGHAPLSIVLHGYVLKCHSSHFESSIEQHTMQHCQSL